MRGSMAVLATVAGSAILTMACGTSTDLIVVNRTQVQLAILPGVLVPACARAEFSDEQIAAAWDRFDADMFDDTWIPGGAARFTLPAVSNIGTEPVQIVVTADGADIGGRLADAPCLGRPPAQ